MRDGKEGKGDSLQTVYQPETYKKIILCSKMVSLFFKQKYGHNFKQERVFMMEKGNPLKPDLLYLYFLHFAILSI